MPTPETIYSLRKFTESVRRLDEGLSIAKDQLGKDGVIQRFEFAFELMWKTLKVFLSEKGISVKTPKDALKEAFRLGWISDELGVLAMLEDRNLTSHTYDLEIANKVFISIQGNHAVTLRHIVETLTKVQ